MKHPYWKLSYTIRLNLSKIIGKIARSLINLIPECPCGCGRSRDVARWEAIGFDVTGFSETSIYFKDGQSTMCIMPDYKKKNVGSYKYYNE